MSQAIKTVNQTKFHSIAEIVSATSNEPLILKGPTSKRLVIDIEALEDNWWGEEARKSQKEGTIGIEATNKLFAKLK